MPITDSRVRKGILTLGVTPGTDFSCQPTAVAITPENTGGDAEEVEVLCGEFATDATSATLGAALTMTAIQDFTAASGASLIGYSWVHNNEELPFTWQPTENTADKWTGRVVVQALTVGGDVGVRITTDAAWKVTDLSLPTNLGGDHVIDGGTYTPPAADADTAKAKRTKAA